MGGVCVWERKVVREGDKEKIISMLRALLVTCKLILYQPNKFHVYLVVVDVGKQNIQKNDISGSEKSCIY